MLKTIIRENKRLFFLILVIFIIIIVVHIIDINKSSKLENSIVLQYDSLKNNDIIPFNSRIDGNAYLYADYTTDTNKYYYSTNGISTSFLNVYYCKDSKCLNNENYDVVEPLVKLGNNNNFSYYVSSYNDIFNVDSSEYIAWEVHLVPFQYYSYYENDKTQIIGTYYNILLIPTSNNKNSCLLDDTKITWTKEKNYQVSTIGDWNRKDNIYFYNRSNKSTYSVLEFELYADAKDIILFDLKSNSNTLLIKLNDQSINDDIGISNDNGLYNIYTKYDTKIIYIKDSGNYKIQFIDDRLDSSYNINYNSYTYVKDFMVLSIVDRSKANKYYIECDTDIVVGNSDDV